MRVQWLLAVASIRVVLCHLLASALLLNVEVRLEIWNALLFTFNGAASEENLNGELMGRGLVLPLAVLRLLLVPHVRLNEFLN